MMSKNEWVYCPNTAFCKAKWSPSWTTKCKHCLACEPFKLDCKGCLSEWKICNISFCGNIYSTKFPHIHCSEHKAVTGCEECFASCYICKLSVPKEDMSRVKSICLNCFNCDRVPEHYIKNSLYTLNGTKLCYKCYKLEKPSAAHAFICYDDQGVKAMCNCCIWHTIKDKHKVQDIRPYCIACKHLDTVNPMLNPSNKTKLYRLKEKSGGEFCDLEWELAEVKCPLCNKMVEPSKRLCNKLLERQGISQMNSIQVSQMLGLSSEDQYRTQATALKELQEAIKKNGH